MTIEFSAWSAKCFTLKDVSVRGRCALCTERCALVTGHSKFEGVYFFFSLFLPKLFLMIDFFK
jgi:hypothetical protein